MTTKEEDMLRMRVDAVGRKRVAADMGIEYTVLSRCLTGFQRLTPARKAEIEALLSRYEGQATV